MSKISELSDGGVIQGGDTLIAVRSGGNVKVTYGGSTTANIDGGTIDGTTIGGTTPAAGNFTTGSFTGNVSFGDNASITLGDSSDLRLKHTGSESFIADEGAGNLNLVSNAAAVTLGIGTIASSSTILSATSTGIDVTGTVDASLDLLVGGAVAGNAGTRTINVGTAGSVAGGVQIWAGTTQTSFLQFGDDSSISANHYRGYLSYNHSTDTLALGAAGSTKVSVTSTGIDVTGTVTADGVNTNYTNGFKVFDGSELEASWTHVNTTGTSTLNVGRNATWGGELIIQTDTKNRANFASNGDISFYEDTGTTAKFLWDASAERLGIGTSTPSSQLHLSNAGGTTIKLGTSLNTSEIEARESGGANLLVLSSNNSADHMVINGNGNVGVGTSSPSTKLHVNTGAAGYGLTIAANTQTSLTYQMGIDSSSNFAIYDSFAASQRMVIDTSGNVGIGTSTPNSYANFTTLTLDGTNGSEIDLEAAGTLRGQLYSTTSAVGLQTSSATNLPLVLGTNGSERMRISSDGSCRWTPDGTNPDMTLDASGNLLVGKTSNTYNTAGAVLGATGSSNFTRDGNPPVGMNRLSSDGSILNFAKDGTTVGSIGVNGGNNLNIGGSVANHAGLEFVDTAYYPQIAQVGSDGGVDLGGSSRRFKDLYLSGGVVFGSTGGNVTGATLDDYEEGTWTPDVAGSTTAGTSSFTFRFGSYEKVGNIVTVRGYYRIASATGSGSLRITGLPFTAASGNGNYGVVTIGETINLAHTSGYTISGYVVPNTAELQITQIDYSGTNTSTSTLPIDGAHDLLFQCTYRA